MTLTVSWSDARDSTQRFRGLVCSGMASKTYRRWITEPRPSTAFRVS